MTSHPEFETADARQWTQLSRDFLNTPTLVSSLGLSSELYDHSTFNFLNHSAAMAQDPAKEPTASAVPQHVPPTSTPAAPSSEQPLAAEEVPDPDEDDLDDLDGTYYSSPLISHSLKQCRCARRILLNDHLSLRSWPASTAKPHSTSYLTLD